MALLIPANFTIHIHLQIVLNSNEIQVAGMTATNIHCMTASNIGIFFIEVLVWILTLVLKLISPTLMIQGLEYATFHMYLYKILKRKQT